MEVKSLIGLVYDLLVGGKSAVLTALTVALGGKASFTQRAGSLSKLLKEGQE